MDDGASPPIRGSEPRTRVLPWAAAAVFVACALGAFARSAVRALGLDVPDGNNVFFVLYAANELPFLLLTAAFALTVLAAPRAEPSAMTDVEARHGSKQPTPGVVFAIAAVVLLAGWVGSITLTHRFPLAMDEYASAFQARIFASGRLAASVPAMYRGVVVGLAPIYIGYQRESGTWAAMYLPVYSAMRAVFMMVGAEWLTNAALSALSVLLLATLARRLWPDDGQRQSLAILLLATSSQFVVTAATAYAMPAHLCLNLLWLLLLLREDRASLLALPWVGALALGIHNPFPHALFVAPFLVSLLLRRRWGLTAYLGVVYLAASWAWLKWLGAYQPDAQQAGVRGLTAMFRLPSASTLIVQWMNLALTVTWHSPIVGVGLAAAVISMRKLRYPLRELAIGTLLTFGFYIFFPADQGHGWGYRYLFSMLGGVVLLAANEWPTLVATLRPTAARALTIAGLGIAVLSLPVRAIEVEGFVRPFARANALVQNANADVVVLAAQQWWYGRDLVRNDPSLAFRPLVISERAIDESELSQFLLRLGPGRNRVAWFTFDSLAHVGMRSSRQSGVAPPLTR